MKDHPVINPKLVQSKISTLLSEAMRMAGIIIPPDMNCEVSETGNQYPTHDVLRSILVHHYDLEIVTKWNKNFDGSPMVSATTIPATEMVDPEIALWTTSPDMASALETQMLKCMHLIDMTYNQ